MFLSVLQSLIAWSSSKAKWNVHSQVQGIFFRWGEQGSMANSHHKLNGTLSLLNGPESCLLSELLITKSHMFNFKISDHEQTLRSLVGTIRSLANFLTRGIPWSPSSSYAKYKILKYQRCVKNDMITMIRDIKLSREAGGRHMHEAKKWAPKDRKIHQYKYAKIYSTNPMGSVTHYP